MHYSSSAVERAVMELSKLPGVGRKSAQRMVFYLLKQSPQAVNDLSTSLSDLVQKVKFCSICNNIAEEETCEICRSEKRDRSIICVVEEANDIWAFERTGDYRGLYHVLGGVLSPLDGIGPDDLHVKELLQRLDDSVHEVIVATNPSTEGEATALYLAKLIKPLAIKLTRIARGIPVGADLEHADEMTLSRALEGRAEI
ncbi:MAG TPA: recombination mediator RecR [bacterium]|nr:recombination mediator RecR [bacterium]HPG45232.1 recombination mediator RecR [bacterium]HPM97474.1 recombination mediator RecR [bacterium]